MDLSSLLNPSPEAGIERLFVASFLAATAGNTLGGLTVPELDRVHAMDGAGQGRAVSGGLLVERELMCDASRRNCPSYSASPTKLEITARRHRCR
jgi:hypothetical protein